MVFIMKALVYKDFDGEEFIYNDDTGMIFRMIRNYYQLWNMERANLLIIWIDTTLISLVICKIILFRFHEMSIL